MADNGESRLEKVRSRRRFVKRLTIIAISVLALGLLVGAGMNLIFGKPKAASVKTAEQAKKTTPAEQTSPQDRGPTTTQFSTTIAMSHVFALCEHIGERPGGSVKESAAADYLVARLGEYGYTVEDQQFTTSDGFASRNILGTRRGSREGFTIVIAAHYDSPVDSKGADDNASGAGAVLELARVFSARNIEPTIQFVFLGCNRPGGTDLKERLVGARRHVELLGSLEKRDIVAMIELDSVGQGETLALRTQGTGLQRLKDKLETYARQENIPATYIKSTSDSDNIPFEDSRIPAVWVQWCDPSGALTTDNLYTSIVAEKVEAAGLLVEGFILGLEPTDLEDLKY